MTVKILHKKIVLLFKYIYTIRYIRLIILERWLHGIISYKAIIQWASAIP